MKSMFKPKVLVPVLGVVLVAGFVAYILFAPSTMWKPVYIRFDDGATAAHAQEMPEGQPLATVAPAARPRAAEVIPYRPGEGIMYSLGTKIVNLAEPGGRRYLQIAIVLECLPAEAGFYALQGEARAKAAEHETESLEALRPVMEDAVIGLLTSRTYAEVFTIEGKDRLKQEIISEINAMLGEERVASIYFTEFLVQ